jgi:predicted DNA-binding transcriptional regulator YafY
MSKRIIDRLERLDFFIRTKATGTPEQLASKLGISRSTLYDYIAIMKQRGAPISFSRDRKCFYYKTEGRFRFTYSPAREL